jgi:hypothetical protein
MMADGMMNDGMADGMMLLEIIHHSSVIKS